MSSNEIASTNRTMAHALHNAKMLLQADGSLIETAGKQEAGQMAFALNTSGNKRKGTYYSVSIGKSLWQNMLGALLFPTKWGAFMPSVGTFSSDVLGLLRKASTNGTYSMGSIDTSDGENGIFVSASSAGSKAGFNYGRLFTTRGWNPIICAHIKMSVSTGVRWFIGWTGSTSDLADSDDPFNALNSFGFAKLTDNTNFVIAHNDNAGITQKDDTLIAADTSAHTIRLWADGANNKFWWSIDGSTPIAVTTDIPSDTAQLSLQDTGITQAASAITNRVFGFVMTTGF